MLNFNMEKFFNRTPIHIFLIIIIGLIAYSNTFNVPFHFDDARNIVENYKLRDLDNFWPPSGSRWFGFLTFAINYHFGGFDTFGYHIVNLSIHILNAILVYWLVILTFKTPYFQQFTVLGSRFTASTALFSALIFVSHPIQTQAVTYIIQRFTSLATMFCLLSLVMYIKARLVTQNTEKVASSKQSGVSKKLYATRYTLYAVSLVSAILAMKTKEISFTLPVIIALYEFMFFNEKIRRRILYLIPFLLTMFIIPFSLVGVDRPVGDMIGELREASQETTEIPRRIYLFTQFRVIVTYIRLLFLPVNQNLDYDYPIYHSFLNADVLLSFLFLISIFGLGVYLYFRSRFTADYSLFTIHCLRLTAFGIFWFFITLSVESSIIPIRDVIFEHRVYLPSIGAFFTMTTFVFIFVNKSLRAEKVLMLVLAVIIILLSGTTYARNLLWHDGVTLWSDVIRKSPEKARPHNNLGIAYKNQGYFDEAIKEYKIALDFSPDNAEAHHNLGVIYGLKGRVDEAIQEYRIALNIKSKFFTPMEIAKIHNNIGVLHSKQGLFDEAVVEYRIALELSPNFEEAHYNLAIAYFSKGAVDNARKEFETILRINPHNPEALRFLNYIEKRRFQH